MAKFIDNDVFDNGLNHLKNNATEMYLTDTQPADRAAAIAAALASKTGLTSGSYTGPVDGDVSGRKITKNAESGISVGTSGNVNHVTLCSASKILMITTVTTQAVTAGNTINTPAYKFELKDPA